MRKGGTAFGKNGEVALVTGASRGIGRAIALRLARDGYNVVVNFKSSKNEAFVLADLIRTELKVKALPLQADVARANEVEAMVGKIDIDMEFGRIDVLVNNAGIVRDSLLVRMGEKDWDKAALRIMQKQCGGRIINISLIVGQRGNAGGLPYPVRGKGKHMRNRIVITGIGVVTPIGIGKERFWGSLESGKSGVDRVTSFDATRYASQIAAEVKEFNPGDFIPRRFLKSIPRFAQFAVVQPGKQLPMLT